MKQSSNIAVLGGTGREGRGLAFRWARAGHKIIIGSRSLERARTAAEEISGMLGGSPVTGADNLSAARAAEIVVIAVPYSAHRDTLEAVRDALQGKLLIDVTVPLVQPKTKVQMPAAGSAALEAREILGEGADIADAFQNISHEQFLNQGDLDCDVLVAGTSRAARERTLELVADAGFVGWDAGPIENSVVVEGLPSLLIHINRQYGSTRAGIRITGVAR